MKSLSLSLCLILWSPSLAIPAATITSPTGAIYIGSSPVEPLGTYSGETPGSLKSEYFLDYDYVTDSDDDNLTCRGGSGTWYTDENTPFYEADAFIFPAGVGSYTVRVRNAAGAILDTKQGDIVDPAG